MDVGKIYIQEKGKRCRLVSSPVRRNIRKKYEEKYRNVFNSKAMHEYWNKYLIIDEKIEVNSPKSLLFICMEFVVENVEYVESLRGIPEEIGEEMCNKLVRNSITHRVIPSCEVLRIFVDAYKEKMLENLSLRNCLLAINEFFDVFQVFLPYIRELDLSYCRLGDSHELIEELGQLQCLRSLNLTDNALSDKTLRRLSLCQSKGPVNLTFLCLAYNKNITSAGLEKLSCYQRLELLDITGIKLDVKKLENKLNMFVTNSEVEYSIEMQGWCSILLQGIVKGVSLMVEVDGEARSSEEIRFYGRRSKLRLKLFEDNESSNERMVILRKSEISKSSQNCKINKQKSRSTSNPIKLSESEINELTRIYK